MLYPGGSRLRPIRSDSKRFVVACRAREGRGSVRAAVIDTQVAGSGGGRSLPLPELERSSRRATSEHAVTFGQHPTPVDCIPGRAEAPSEPQ